MALRLFRLKRTPQPGPAPGSPSAPADSDPTDPVTGTPGPPPTVIHAGAKKARTKPARRAPAKAKGKPGKKKR